MKRFIAALLFCCTSTLSFGVVQDCSVPAGQPANPGVSPPILPTKPNSQTWDVFGSPASCSPFRTQIKACQDYVAASGWQGVSIGIGFPNPNAPNQPYCQVFNADGSSVTNAPLFSTSCTGANAVCPDGYVDSGSGCKSKAAIAQDQAAATNGEVITRDADGNITSDWLPNGTKWTITAIDSLKRPTNFVDPAGRTIVLTYFANSPLVATWTDQYGTTSYTWLNDVHPNTISTPDGSTFKFNYTEAAGKLGQILNSVTVTKPGAVPGTVVDPLPIGTVGARLTTNFSGVIELHYDDGDANRPAIFPVGVPHDAVNICVLPKWIADPIPGPVNQMLCRNCPARCAKNFGTQNGWYSQCLLQCYSTHNCF